MVVKGFPARVSIVSCGSPSRDELFNALISYIEERFFGFLIFKGKNYILRKEIYIYIPHWLASSVSRLRLINPSNADNGFLDR